MKMTTRLALRAQEGLDDLPRGVGREPIGAECEHVGVVVTARHRGHLGIHRQRRTYIRKAIRGVGDTETRAADPTARTHINNMLVPRDWTR